MNMYIWADGSHMSGDANVAGKICDKLEMEGRLSAAELVNESRAEDSPLHDMFEWNDTIAAEKYRETQAQKIIRSIVKVVENEPLDYRAYSSIAPNSYVSTTNALSKEETRAIILRNAKRELETFKRKYGKLMELSKLINVIDEVIAS